MSVHHSSSVDFVLSEEQPKPGGASRVLVIENDRELAEEIRLELEAGGHAVQVAETLTEGLPAARSGDASVLVVDPLRALETWLAASRGSPGHGKWTPALAISELTS